ncbi:uncharacterized protein LOC119401614 [Rhipicephalus sanguineus]|nr:uncharacterized protein LOC119401614 [Rhipicephalus sanguineus]XP_037524442.1 uncharacterized protein LOC119401614 [Rhipicephalus sanguineus]
MSTTEAMADDISEFGDPYELVEAEELVMLKLEAPLPPGRSVPKAFAVSSDRSMLTTDYIGFVNNRGFLVKYSYPRALFAGCRDFKGGKGFLATARDVLCKTHTLVIVHNRDAVVDLAAWFPGVLALVLFHNLNCQRTEKAHMQGNRPISRMNRLCGTTPGLGAEELFLSPFALTTLFAFCPDISHVQAPMEYIVKMAGQVKAEGLRQLPLLESCRELTLGRLTRIVDGRYVTMSEVDENTMKMAIEQYPDIEQLQVAAMKPNAIPLIARFTRLRRLHLMSYSDGRDELCRFDRLIKLLEELRLTHLKLMCFMDVSLLKISEACKNLESLSLTECAVSDENVPRDAFLKLKSLALADGIKEKPFFSLLRAARGLTELRLENRWTVMMFVGGPLNSPRQRHEFLRSLTLGTDLAVTRLQVSIADLHAMMQSTPALVTLRTDSYDIRLFVGHFHPRVRLTWTACTVCAAEFPKMDAEQAEMWRDVYIGDLLKGNCKGHRNG